MHIAACQLFFAAFALSFASFFEILSFVSGLGGWGMIPAWPSSLPTVEEGCAPTDSQYLRMTSTLYEILLMHLLCMELVTAHGSLRCVPYSVYVQPNVLIAILLCSR